MGGHVTRRDATQCWMKRSWWPRKLRLCTKQDSERYLLFYLKQLLFYLCMYGLKFQDKFETNCTMIKDWTKQQQNMKCIAQSITWFMTSQQRISITIYPNNAQIFLYTFRSHWLAMLALNDAVTLLLQKAGSGNFEMMHRTC